MKSVYIKELRRYSQSDLSSILNMDDSRIVPFLEKTRRIGVLKIISIGKSSEQDLSEIQDSDADISDIIAGDTRHYYVFNFVGVLIIDEYLLKVYPKYIFDLQNIDEKFQEVISVLKKSDESKQWLKSYTDLDSSVAFNKLSVSLTLLNDYFENGSYRAEKRIIERNGTGEALWDKTVNEIYAVIVNRRPYYPEIYTRKKIRDNTFYYHRLHLYILTKISEELNDVGILDLFGMTEVELSDESMESLGGEEFAKEQIVREQRVEFNSRKLMLLKLMLMYLEGAGSSRTVDWFQLFGTKSYHVIWEKMCSDVFDNQRFANIEKINLPSIAQSPPMYEGITCLMDIICKPRWKVCDSSQGMITLEAASTLRPDFLSIAEHDGVYTFYILDAKYYVILLEKGKGIVGQPGVEDIVKQYMYQQAFQDFIKTYGITKVENCFLMPYDGDSVISKGTVCMPMMNDLNLANIEIRLVPARIINQHYIDNSKIKDLSYLHIG